MTKTWRERIAEAKERGRFLPEDKVALRGWKTCLVSEQRMTHPQVIVMHDEPWLGPKDPTLNKLGTAAYKAGPKKAEQLLDKIEDRVLQLKREKGA